VAYSVIDPAAGIGGRAGCIAGNERERAVSSEIAGNGQRWEVWELAR